mgnify:CR=1 FL=1
MVDPGQEDIGVDAAFKKTDGDQMETEQGTDDVGTAPGVPVKASITALSDGRVTPAARHVLGKAALVNPHQHPPGRFILRPSDLKGAPCGVLRARRHGCFFYSSPAAYFSARNRSHSALPPTVPPARIGRHRGRPARLVVRPPCPACDAEPPTV